MTQHISWGETSLIASRKLNLISDELINKVLHAVADEAVVKTDMILAANQKDLATMDKSNPMYDRLLLNADRIAGIASDIRNVASLPTPLGKLLEQRTLLNGLNLSKISVPFGVIGIIYEARPNVSFDVFSLCFKSGNTCVLKGGTDAYHSNLAIVTLIQEVLERFEIDKNVIHLLPAGREATAELLNAVDYVDLIIPRGSQGLINFVRDNSRVPVIETGAGVCHTYFDEFGDKEKGANIINNAKTRRVSVCNALDCLIINEKRLPDLPYLCQKLAESNVVIEADIKAFTFLVGKYPSQLLEKTTETSFGTEFVSYRMSIKTATDIHDAIEHISKYSSKHSEAIITENEENIAIFDKQVDAACVYSNASTAFTDGAQFGMGAEIGISTQKLHARGPMALPELTSYKWIIKGNGQTRPK
ncbi:MAG: glutamate-5-semialdehyde dehydrogenase [Dysgonamonadaceae bacterium]|jgi:glutamate-5-semialdehyde dehydrogenase|nr:glutamate-5-semialdehyde dehydrogenase [Dysgonamonadaceae bacterium]